MDGRPSKLTKVLIKKAGKLLKEGLYVNVVAAALGIDRSTWFNWLKRGGREAKRLRKSRAKPIAADVLYLEFFDTIKRTEALAEIEDAGAIRKAKPGWQAHAWRLERRWPKRWAKAEPNNDDLDATIRPRSKPLEPQRPAETPPAGCPGP